MKRINCWKFFTTVLLITLLGFTNSQLAAQDAPFGDGETFTRGDTLRGTLGPERDWFDVYYYDLNIKVLPDSQSISGYNDIYFEVLRSESVMQIDLFDFYTIDSILFNGQELTYSREYNAVFIEFPDKLAKSERHKISFYYNGKPIAAANPPWDGGFVWRKDNKERHFVGVACQGLGASSWWPNKDHQSEEPDSMSISCAIPTDLGLQAVANGQNRGTTQEGDYTRFHWFVSYPINNYCVSVTIADFEYFNDYYVSNNDTLALNYYVLDYNLDKAKAQFEQVKPMMACFEEVLGPYPFWNDGFALIETPYLGMEHQSGIAYGNGYKTGYAGRDFSRIGLDFDYIIIHEAGHEWWGNNITSYDIADMWIHEGFCTYSEALYVECLHGYETAMDYVNAKKPSVRNKQPIIGTYGVNQEGSGDMYNKGMLILNTLRHLIADDELWFDIIKGLNEDFRHSVVSQEDIEDYINQKTARNFDKFFEQYLYYKSPPTIEYIIDRKGQKMTLSYKWAVDVPEFEMPIRVKNTKGEWQTINPSTSEWQELNFKGKEVKDMEVEFESNYLYFLTKRVRTKN